MQGADVVHVGVNVGMRRAERRLRGRRVPVRGDPNEGQVRVCWAIRQSRRPGNRANQTQDIMHETCMSKAEACLCKQIRLEGNSKYCRGQEILAIYLYA